MSMCFLSYFSFLISICPDIIPDYDLIYNVVFLITLIVYDAVRKMVYFLSDKIFFIIAVNLKIHLS